MPDLTTYATSNVLHLPGGAQQTTSFDVDVPSNSAQGEISVAAQSGNLEMEMIRTRKLTWLQAPDEYWKQLKFDQDSIERARGKYVVFNQEVGEQLYAQYDPTALIKSLEDVDMSKVKVQGAVDLDGDDAYRFSSKFGSKTMTIDVSKTGRTAIRFIGDVEGASSKFTYLDFGKKVDIRPPSAEQVMQES